MSVAIKLDKSKTFGECKGDRTAADPLYSVAFWQGQYLKTTKNGRPHTAFVQLPFDAHGNLVPDDGQKEPKPGIDAEGKPTTFHPLYNDLMRELLSKKGERAKVLAERVEESEAADDVDLDDPVQAAEEVNLAEWLKGNAKYEWPVLQATGKKRFNTVWMSKKQIVTELVFDHKIVDESEVCAAFAQFLKEPAAA